MTVPIRSLVGKPDRDVPMSPVLDDGDINITSATSGEQEEESSMVIESTAQFEGERNSHILMNVTHWENRLGYSVLQPLYRTLRVPPGRGWSQQEDRGQARRGNAKRDPRSRRRRLFPALR